MYGAEKMKKLFLILLICLTGFTFTNQDQTLSNQGKEIIGKWTNENSDHPMKESVPGTIRHLTFEIKSGNKLQLIDVYTKNGKELITTTEPGTWEMMKDKITFHYSGKAVMSRNGEKINKDRKNDVVMIYDGKSSAPKKVKASELTDRPRSVSFYYKIDNNNLLLTSKKGDFKNPLLFKKN